jgi:hypothetical protein
MGSKDDPVPSQNQVVPTMNPKPRLPQKFLLRVVAHQVSQTHFLSSLSKSRDEISFKGGSLSHPKNLEYENKQK